MLQRNIITSDNDCQLNIINNEPIALQSLALRYEFYRRDCTGDFRISDRNFHLVVLEMD